MSNVRRAYEAGRVSFLEGGPLSSPYLRHLPEDEAWRAGWMDASGIDPHAPATFYLDNHLQQDLWRDAPHKGAIGALTSR